MAAIYAYIIQNYGTMDVGNQFVAGVMVGNLRAFAGLCAGAFAHHLNGYYIKLPDLKRGKAFIRVMDVASWIMAVLLFVFPKDVIPDPDMLFWMIPFAVILLHGVNDFGPVSRWLNSHGCAVWAWLGRLSPYVYLLHLQAILLLRRLIVTDSSIAGSMLVLAAAVACCALIMVILDKIRKWRTPVRKGD